MFFKNTLLLWIPRNNNNKTLLWSGSVDLDSLLDVCLHRMLYLLLPDRALLSQRRWESGFCLLRLPLTRPCTVMTHVSLKTTLRDRYYVSIGTYWADISMEYIVWYLTTTCSDQTRVSGLSITWKVDQPSVLETFEIVLLTLWNI